MKVLIIEDGFEYLDTLQRFLPDIAWSREGSGPRALERLANEPFDAIFCDMKFDRTPEAEILGDAAAAAEAFNGDPAQGRAWLAQHQGTYVVAALRAAGHALPVLWSYDFHDEPQRWARLRARYAPIDDLPDHAAPAEVARRLRALVGRSVNSG